jgi:hypothetical protein
MNAAGSDEGRKRRFLNGNSTTAPATKENRSDLETARVFLTSKKKLGEDRELTLRLIVAQKECTQRLVVREIAIPQH